MKKTILCCTFILFPLFAYAQSVEKSPANITTKGNLSSLFKVLETNLGQKMLDTITDEGGTVLYDEASFLSTPYITSVIAPIEYATGEWKKLAYVKIFNLKEFLLTTESDHGMLKLQFPSGKTTVIGGSQNPIETVDSGTMFQEYDDADNTIRINQMMPPWGGMFWMYFWMYFWMLFMGPYF